MYAKKRSVSCGDGDDVDRISALPVCLRESILERMPIKDAMRTSILSKSWAYCWTGMTVLTFYFLEIESAVADCSAFNRILKLHRGPVRRVSIQFNDQEDEIDMHLLDGLYEWLLVLSSKGIQEIHIDAYPGGLLWPRSLFLCKDLKMLALECSTIAPPPDFSGFCNLVHLDLYHCVAISDVLGSFISQCPLLEYLSLTDTCNNFMHDDDLLVITALNLRTLIFEDESWDGVIFKDIPRLTSISARVYLSHENLEVETPCKSWDLICSLPELEHISYDAFLLTTDVIDNFPRSMPRFEKLKTFKLKHTNVSVKEQISFVFCLMRNSPVLQDLTITFRSCDDETLNNGKEEARKLLETETSEHSKLSSLSNVVFENFEWSSNVVMLVKLMLSRCPSLKTCKIDALGEEDTMKQILKELEDLPNKDKLDWDGQSGGSIVSEICGFVVVLSGTILLHICYKRF